jgi:single-stranded DNA-binding protein
VRGRLQTSTYETDDGIKKKVVEVIVEKLTFLSSRKTEPKEIDA